MNNDNSIAKLFAERNQQQKTKQLQLETQRIEHFSFDYCEDDQDFCTHYHNVSEGPEKIAAIKKQATAILDYFSHHFLASNPSLIEQVEDQKQTIMATLERIEQLCLCFEYAESFNIDAFLTLNHKLQLFNESDLAKIHQSDFFTYTDFYKIFNAIQKSIYDYEVHIQHVCQALAIDTPEQTQKTLAQFASKDNSNNNHNNQAPEIKDETEFFVAIQQGNINFLAQMLRGNEDLIFLCLDEQGLNLFEYAVATQQNNIVQLFIELVTKSNRDLPWKLAHCYAAMGDEAGLKSCANLNVETDKQESIFVIAARNNQIGLITFLVSEFLANLDFTLHPALLLPTLNVAYDKKHLDFIKQLVSQIDISSKSQNSVYCHNVYHSFLLNRLYPNNDQTFFQDFLTGITDRQLLKSIYSDLFSHETYAVRFLPLFLKIIPFPYTLLEFVIWALDECSNAELMLNYIDLIKSKLSDIDFDSRIFEKRIRYALSSEQTPNLTLLKSLSDLVCQIQSIEDVDKVQKDLFFNYRTSNYNECLVQTLNGFINKNQREQAQTILSYFPQLISVIDLTQGHPVWYGFKQFCLGKIDESFLRLLLAFAAQHQYHYLVQQHSSLTQLAKVMSNPFAIEILNQYCAQEKAEDLPSEAIATQIQNLDPLILKKDQPVEVELQTLDNLPSRYCSDKTAENMINFYRFKSQIETFILKASVFLPAMSSELSELKKSATYIEIFNLFNKFFLAHTPIDIYSITFELEYCWHQIREIIGHYTPLTSLTKSSLSIGEYDIPLGPAASIVMYALDSTTTLPSLMTGLGKSNLTFFKNPGLWKTIALQTEMGEPNGYVAKHQLQTIATKKNPMFRLHLNPKILSLRDREYFNAIIHNNLEKINELLHNNVAAIIQTTDALSFNLLEFAQEFKYEHVVRSFVEVLAHTEYAAEAYAITGDTESLKKILQRQVVSPKQVTRLLILAAKNDQPEIAKFLLTHYPEEIAAAAEQKVDQQSFVVSNQKHVLNFLSAAFFFGKNSFITTIFRQVLFSQPQPWHTATTLALVQRPDIDPEIVGFLFAEHPSFDLLGQLYVLCSNINNSLSSIILNRTDVNIEHYLQFIASVTQHYTTSLEQNYISQYSYTEHRHDPMSYHTKWKQERMSLLSRQHSSLINSLLNKGIDEATSILNQLQTIVAKAIRNNDTDTLEFCIYCFNTLASRQDVQNLLQNSIGTFLYQQCPNYSPLQLAYECGHYLIAEMIAEHHPWTINHPFIILYALNNWNQMSSDFKQLPAATFQPSIEEKKQEVLLKMLDHLVFSNPRDFLMFIPSFLINCFVPQVLNLLINEFYRYGFNVRELMENVVPPEQFPHWLNFLAFKNMLNQLDISQLTEKEITKHLFSCVIKQYAQETNPHLNEAFLLLENNENPDAFKCFVLESEFDEKASVTMKNMFEFLDFLRQAPALKMLLGKAPTINMKPEPINEHEHTSSPRPF